MNFKDFKHQQTLAVGGKLKEFEVGKLCKTF
jgi:hypothetical protein